MNKTLLFVLLLFVALVRSVVGAQETRARVMFRIYDLRDLLGNPPADEAASRPAKDRDHPLCRAIRAFIRPPIDEDAKLSMLNGDQLIASLTEVQHERLLEILVAMRKPMPAIFRVETQFVVASAEQAAKIGIDSGAPVYVADDAALAVVRNEIAAMKGAFVGPLESTEIVCGRPGRDEVFNELTYVKAWEKHENVEPGKRTLVVPVLATEREGSFLDVLAIELPDGRIGCLLKATLVQIGKPVPSRDTPDGPVAAPVVTTMAIEAKATFDGKMTILFPGPARDGRVPFVLTRVAPGATGK